MTGGSRGRGCTAVAKLLRALQQGEIQRIGSDRVHKVDVRVIAATNRDLEQEVLAGRFRADLYHRLAVFPLRVPPLRERREDIPLLAVHFLDDSRRRLGLGRLRLSDAALDRLVAADWPGNVRELANVLSRAVLRAAAGLGAGASATIEEAHLDVPSPGDGPDPLPAADREAPSARTLRERVDEVQRRAIREAARRHGGNWAAAARELGLHRSNLHRLARRLGVGGGTATTG